jgi:hypothetical protein
MKKILVSLLLGLAMSFSAAAQTPTRDFTVTLEWDPNPEPDIAGYNIYARPLGGEYLMPTLVVTNGVRGNITLLAPGSTWFFVATAYNTSGLESDFSIEVSVTLPSRPAAPVLRITSTNLVVTVSTNTP